nr:hypothetical protein Iba_scaffold16286CG0100 [Ipomoea batatas]GME19254.1 hypothetical protein Iba_scaffold22285CG0020 [Ipomoea batatas]
MRSKEYNKNLVVLRTIMKTEPIPVVRTKKSFSEPRDDNSELHPQRVHDISNRLVFWIGYRVLPEQFIHLHDVFLHSRRETSRIKANRRDPDVDTASVEAQFKSDFKPGFETHLAAFLYTGG